MEPPRLLFIRLSAFLIAFKEIMYILGYGRPSYPDVKTQFFMNGKELSRIGDGIRPLDPFSTYATDNIPDSS
ncbi:hypothetical protein SAMN04488121_102964 [Chitinophaga filiformis]|uniref:Uncharacterized protein n=1 Tax=Chitinophaga filiformis TaxID=104663 RepID=A0A1G7NVX2_CHIFI|nr:hypothetical protein SAMN04488121_102964 [Chitinophaga filiformis]